MKNKVIILAGAVILSAVSFAETAPMAVIQTKPHLQPESIPGRLPYVEPSLRPQRTPNLQPESIPGKLPYVVPALVPTKEVAKTPVIKPHLEPNKVPTIKPHLVPSITQTTPKIVVDANDNTAALQNAKSGIQNNKNSIKKDNIQVATNRKTISNNSKAIDTNRNEIARNSQKIDENNDRAMRGVSQGMAMAAIKYDGIQEGHFSLGAGVGSYSDQTSIAVGTAYKINDDMLVNASVSGTDQDETFGYSAGFSYNL